MSDSFFIVATDDQETLYPFSLHLKTSLFWHSPTNPPFWVLAEGFSLSYHNKENILFTTDPHFMVTEINSQQQESPSLRA